LVLFLFNLGAAHADPPPEWELKVAIHHGDATGGTGIANQDKAARILKAWMGSGVEELQRRALHYFNNMPEYMSPTRKEFATWVLKEKKSAAYAAVIDYVRKSDPSVGQALSANQGLYTREIIALIDTDPKMKELLTKKNGPYLIEEKTPEKVSYPVLKVRISETDFEISQALLQKGLLPDVKHVKFGESPTLTLDKSAPPMDWSAFANYVLGTPEPKLYGELAQLRQKLGPNTHPTRLELTELMIEAAKKGEPANAQALRAAVRKQMVTSEPHRYASSGDPYTYPTLNISLKDQADLRMARLLAERNEFVGVDDAGKPKVIETINWNDTSEKHPNPEWNKVNYINSTEVRPDESVGTIIDENNFVKEKPSVVKGAPPIPVDPNGPQLRVKKLLDQSQTTRNDCGLAATNVKQVEADKAKAAAQTTKSR
jgi:hypothetical protein